MKKLLITLVLFLSTVSTALGNIGVYDSGTQYYDNGYDDSYDSITRPKTERVRGHYRKNGTYVEPYYRSKRRSY